jgi:uncharacterized protein (DUF2384 family)
VSIINKKGAAEVFLENMEKLPLPPFFPHQHMPVIPFVFERNQHRSSLGASLPPGRLIEASHNSLPLVATIQKSTFNRNKLPTDRDWQSISSRLMRLLDIGPEALRTYWQDNIVPDTEKSKQAMQLVRLIELGQEVFGEAVYFNTWLLKPAYGLMGKLPLELFYTTRGIDLITDELIRVVYGEAIL